MSVAMGLTAADIAKPLVGVVSCWNEAAPCNISLMRQAQAVKKGVASASGTPREVQGNDAVIAAYLGVDDEEVEQVEAEVGL